MLTGINVTDEEFKTINDMYMVAGDDFGKSRFCEDFKKHGESTLLNRFYNMLRDAIGELGELNDKLNEANSKLAHAEEEAKNFRRWWHEESANVEKVKNECESKLNEADEKLAAFKKNTVDTIKFIVGQL